MKTFITALAVLFLAASADANTITINAGESPTFPPTFTTLATGGSPLILSPTVCCGVSNSFIVAASAVGTPPLPSGQLDTSTIAVSATGPGTLFIWITEQGLTFPLGNEHITSGLTDNLEQGAISSVTLATFFDSTNGVGPPNGTPLDSFGFTHIGAQTNDVGVSTGPGPYSLQALYEVTATGAGNVNLTIDLTSAVPEPVTMVLLGSALVGLALLRRRVGAA